MAEQSLGPVFAISVADVCNNALDQIRQEPISGLDDLSPAGKACRRYFPTVLRAMLRDHKWNFSKRRVNCPRLTAEEITRILGGYGTGGFGSGGFGGAQQDIVSVPVLGPYTYWFALPNNHVRVWGINNDPTARFEVQGKILMTERDSCQLEYAAYIDDPNIWDGMFQVAFESILASKLCLRLLKDGKEAAALFNAYLLQKEEAKSADGQEGSPDILLSNYLLDIRE